MVESDPAKPIVIPAIHSVIFRSLLFISDSVDIPFISRHAKGTQSVAHCEGVTLNALTLVARLNNLFN